MVMNVFVQAGPWEEKNLNKWATDRMKELLKCIGFLEFSNGKAEVTEAIFASSTGKAATVRARAERER
ncbi:hypothetical protein AKJ16_DCAP22122 [Drosera capensis]